MLQVCEEPGNDRLSDAGARAEQQLPAHRIQRVGVHRHHALALGVWRHADIEVGADVHSFVADPKRVEQILSNLLSNAIGFSDRGATIRMGAKKTRGQLQLWVSDQGRGIEPEFQKQAFDRFQSRPVPGGHRGPGLGLAIVKSFVELHEGQVSLLSKINQGTTVLCTFPLDGPAAAQRTEVRKSA